MDRLFDDVSLVDCRNVEFYPAGMHGCGNARSVGRFRLLNSHEEVSISTT
jgi:hypothetical protein